MCCTRRSIRGSVSRDARGAKPRAVGRAGGRRGRGAPERTRRRDHGQSARGAEGGGRGGDARGCPGDGGGPAGAEGGGHAARGALDGLRRSRPAQVPVDHELQPVHALPRRPHRRREELRAETRAGRVLAGVRQRPRVRLQSPAGGEVPQRPDPDRRGRQGLARADHEPQDRLRPAERLRPRPGHQRRRSPAGEDRAEATVRPVPHEGRHRPRADPSRQHAARGGRREQGGGDRPLGAGRVEDQRVRPSPAVQGLSREGAAPHRRGRRSPDRRRQYASRGSARRRPGLHPGGAVQGRGRTPWRREEPHDLHGARLVPLVHRLQHPKAALRRPARAAGHRPRGGQESADRRASVGSRPGHQPALPQGLALAPRRHGARVRPRPGPQAHGGCWPRRRHRGAHPHVDGVGRVRRGRAGPAVPAQEDRYHAQARRHRPGHVGGPREQARLQRVLSLVQRAV